MDGMIGVFAALGSVLLFGSYAVPIRSPSVMAAQIDPLIFQFYKSFACFTTSWLLLLYLPLRFTWWGLAGGGLWVMTGVGAITAVQLAGIGTAQALWSGLSSLSSNHTSGIANSIYKTQDSTIDGLIPEVPTVVAERTRLWIHKYIVVFVSYIWGAYYFKEPIRNHTLSLVALVIMAIGMIGVGSAASGNKLLSAPQKLPKSPPQSPLSSAWQANQSVDENPKKSMVSDEEEQLLAVKEDCKKLACDKEKRFTQGVLYAVFVGLLNGSFMIPLKFANREVVGAEYLLSFGVGAMTITTVVLAIYSFVLVCMGRPRPKFQVRVAVMPALLTGLLWSIGNYCSIYATLYLGVALGWPMVQCQILVSTLWAVFYYEEVTGPQEKVLLIGSSALVVSGVVMLSQFGTSD